MIFGLIKWFDAEKVFGVIVSTEIDNKEVFLHISKWKDKNSITTFNKIPLIFTTSIQKNKLSALNCKYFNFENIDQWKHLLGLYGKS